MFEFLNWLRLLYIASVLRFNFAGIVVTLIFARSLSANYTAQCMTAVQLILPAPETLSVERIV